MTFLAIYLDISPSWFSMCTSHNEKRILGMHNPSTCIWQVNYTNMTVPNSKVPDSISVILSKKYLWVEFPPLRGRKNIILIWLVITRGFCWDVRGWTVRLSGRIASAKVKHNTSCYECQWEFPGGIPTR